MTYPVDKTNAFDGTTEIVAIHINNLENKVGITGDSEVTSLDYRVATLETNYATLLAFSWPSIALDHSYSGNFLSGTVGVSVVFGETLYYKSDGKFWKIDANAETTSKGLCVMALESISANTVGKLLLKGLVRDDSWTWTTTGANLYLSAAATGQLTQTAPSGSTDIVRIAGIVVNATHVWFDPDTSYVEVL